MYIYVYSAYSVYVTRNTQHNAGINPKMVLRIINLLIKLPG